MPAVLWKEDMSRLAQSNWLGVIDYIPALLQGLYYTLLVSVVGLVIGFVLGAIFGTRPHLPQQDRLRDLDGLYRAAARHSGAGAGDLDLLRPAAHHRLQHPSLTAGIVVIGLNSGAYIAEIVRGAVQSVEKGQMEAGRSLGLSQHLTMRYVIWPQAFKRMIPPLGNQFIISIKDTSLLSVILVPELIFQGRLVASNHFNAVEIYTTVAIFYLVITLTLSKVLNIMEKRLTH